MHGWCKYYVLICTLSYSRKYCRMNKYIYNSDSEQTQQSWGEYTSNFLLSGEWVITSVLSHLNKNLKWWTLKPSMCHSSQADHVIALGSRTDHVIALGSIHVTAQFYLENKRKIHFRGVRACRPKRHEEKRTLALWLLFICFFLPLGLPYVNWASQECCLFYPRSSLGSSDLPSSIFAGFSLPCLSATTILDSCFLF